MLHFRSNEQTLVRRMRVVAAGLDPLAASLRVRSAFSPMEMSPSWLAPSAILCVRRLRAPRTRSLRLEGGAARVPREWDDALRAEVERLARAAGRPALEHVPAGAESVIFSDRAELFASLASDWCEREALGARWWWRSLFGATPDRRAVLRVFNDAPEYVPGALARLARDGRAARFAAALSDAEARALLSSLARKFNLRELDRALALAFAEVAGRRSATLHADESTAKGLTSAPRAPWAEVVPECDDRNLGVAARCLLGVGLMLTRSPALSRRDSFARLASEWARGAQGGDAREVATDEGATRNSTRSTAARTADSHATDAHAISTTSRQRGARSVETVSDSLRSSEGKAGSADTSSKTARDDATRPGRDSQDIKATGGKSEREGSAPLAAELARSATARIEDNTVASEIGAQHAQTDADALEVKEQRETSLAVASAPQVAAQESDARESWEASEFEAQIETRFGGLFFLINLALFLDLYGDFTAPNAPCLPLPVWDFVALVGRELAGARVESDPLWSLLARLAGRAGGVEPGEGFEPADVWHVSVEWLKTFPTAGVWLWSAAGGRLRVRHPAGFFVIDAVLERDGTQRQLAREMRPYLEACPGVRLRRVAKHFRVRGHNARERWLTRLTEYVRARLFRALGVGESRELSHLVCERRARVFVTAAHLDVVMRLVELPVAVRFAGLDRDPGWLPVAGRHVAFHFE